MEKTTIKKSTRVDKNTMTESNYSQLLLPVTKDGHPDYRFNKSLERIRSELGDKIIKELSDFSL